MLLALTDITPTGPQSSLERAEALVTSAICPALPTLEEQTWTAEYRMRNDARPYGLPLYGRRRLGPEVLRYWPITSLVSVSQDGTVLDDCVFDAFSIRRDALSPEFLPLGVVSVVFRTGWADVDDMPAAIRQAIILTHQEIEASPLGVKMERLGDVQTEYGAASGTLSPQVMQLLAPWRYVGV